MSLHIACVSGKGGVGKTTTACNLAAAMAATGRSVLAVDVDSQANLTTALGLDPYRLERSISDVFAGRCTVADALVPTTSPGLSLLPSTPLATAGKERAGGGEGREHVLRDALAPVRGSFDHVIFDTPPNFGFDTLNALGAADRVIIPVQLSGFAVTGLKEVLRTAESARSFNPGLEVLGVVLTFVNAQVRFNRELASDLRGLPGVRVFDTVIPTNVRLQETAVAGMPVTEYAPDSRAAGAYRRLAEEVLRGG